MKKKLYIFSGLGADERVFQKLDFSEYTTNFIKWIEPLDQETIEQYSLRLITQISSENPIIIGLSFGGIIAVEVAKLIATENIILIASAKTKNEIPFYFRLIGKLKIHKFIPIRILKSSNFITNWFFGINSKFDKNLLKQILNDTDPKFLKWAIDCIVSWQNKNKIVNLVHIHGTKDRIFPFRYSKSSFFIKGGGHFMTMNKINELNEILKEQI